MSGHESVSPAIEAGRPSRLASQIEAATRLMPGLLLVLVVAVVARLASGLSRFIPDVVIALVLAAIVGNVWALPKSFPAGIRFTHRYLLRTAIIILGVSFSFGVVQRTGGQMLLIILVCFVASFSLGLLAARAVGLSGRIGTLLAGGTAICGATAILTIGPLIAATEAEIAYAVTTIFTYNSLGIIFYPLIGNLLHLTPSSFGTWAGTSINDTAAVVATGYIFGDASGVVATAVKLTRTVLLVPLALLVGIGYGMRQDRKGEAKKITFTKLIPWFVLGFLGTALLNTAGLVPTNVAKPLTDLAKFLIVMVLASVGLGVSLSQMRKLGIKPFLIGMLIGLAMGVASLVLNLLLPIA